jgi:hypothetical protein
MIFDPNLPGWVYLLMLAVLIPALFFPIYGFILLCVVVALAIFIVLETEFDIIDKLKKLLKK